MLVELTYSANIVLVALPCNLIERNLMQYQKTALHNALATILPTIPNKPTNPVLRGVKITTQVGSATLTGSDNNTTITTTVDCDTTTEETLVLPAKTLATIVAACPNKPIHITHNDVTATIKCGASTYTIPVLSDTYPPTPVAPEPLGEINGYDLTHLVTVAKSAISTDDSVRILTGINIVAESGQLTMQATDRFKLVTITTDWPGQDFTALVPGHDLVNSVKNVGTLPVTLAADNGVFSWTAGNTTLTTRMMGEDFPNITPLFPTTSTTVATFKTKDLVDTIKRASIVGVDKNPRIRITIDDTTVIESAGEQESSSHPIDSDHQGAPIEFYANPKYVLDVLAPLPHGTVTLALTQPNRPVMVIGDAQIEDDSTGFTIGDNGHKAVFMPVRGA